MSARLEERIGTGEGVLAIYRAYNAPGEARLAFDSDFGAALNEPSPQELGRGYLGSWETRNLRMAANLRTMQGARPGVRALINLGPSHERSGDRRVGKTGVSTCQSRGAR